MPDATTTPPTPGRLSPTQTILQSEQAIQDITGKETAMAENLQKEDREREAQTGGAIAELEKQRGGLTPPKIEVPEKPEVKQTDPIKQWSSAAMVLAAIGSLFTRRPLTTALNAAAGVLDAYRKNDIETANASYKQWQDSFNNYMKVQQFELDEYKSVLGDIQHREDMVLDIGKQEAQDRIAEVNALGHAFGNQLMAAVRNEQDAWRAIDEHERLMATMRMQAPQLAIRQAQAQALLKLQQSDAFKKATPPQQYDMLRGSPGWSGLTDEQQTMQVARMETQLTRVGTPGNDYMAAQRNLAAVERASARGAAGGVISQAELQDAFTQIINGGRAIRSFQARMNYEHSGLYDRFQAFMNQNGFQVVPDPNGPPGAVKVIAGKGGTLSQRMIDDMKTLSEAVATDRKNVYAIDIINAQEELKEREVSQPKAESLHPYFADTGYLTKMRKAIAFLRDNQTKPEIVKAFDDQFGIDARFAALAGAPIDDTGAVMSEPAAAPGQ